MVPAHAFPHSTEQGNQLAPNRLGFVDTGFSCRRDGDALTVSRPPAGIAAVGGYRFRKSAIEAQVADVDPEAMIVAIPDGIVGKRLAGTGSNLQAIDSALLPRGANPLVAAAFCPRGEAGAAASPSALTGH